LIVPAAVGWKLTVIVHDVPAARVPLQLLVWVNGPETVNELKVIETVLVFVSVTVPGEIVSPRKPANCRGIGAALRSDRMAPIP
jgi:hypothetical protein